MEEEYDEIEEQVQEIKKVTKPTFKKPQEKVEATKVVTQTSDAFKLPNGEVALLHDLLIWMANEILAIRRAVA